MKMIKYSFLMGLAMMGLLSCGKIVKVYTPADDVIQEINVTGEFNGIVTNGIADVEYTDDNEGGAPSITLEASPDLAQATKIYVKNGKLIVTQSEQSRNFNGGGQATVKVSCPGVKSFKTEGVGDIKIIKLNTPSITLETDGTGDIDCKSLTCKTIRAVTDGTGDIEIKNLNCTDAEFITNGVADIEVKNINAENIKAISYGTGDITLAGRYNSLISNSYGTGDIDTKGLKLKNNNK